MRDFLFWVMEMRTKIYIGDPGFDVLRQEQKWGVLPISLKLIEYWGQGDAAFGGSGDDRVVLTDGLVSGERSSSSDSHAVFSTLQDAHVAALSIPNRRPDSILGVAPIWR